MGATKKTGRRLNAVKILTLRENSDITISGYVTACILAADFLEDDVVSVSTKRRANPEEWATDFFRYTEGLAPDCLPNILQVGLADLWAEGIIQDDNPDGELVELAFRDDLYDDL